MPSTLFNNGFTTFIKSVFLVFDFARQFVFFVSSCVLRCLCEAPLAGEVTILQAVRTGLDVAKGPLLGKVFEHPNTQAIYNLFDVERDASITITRSI